MRGHIPVVFKCKKCGKEFPSELPNHLEPFFGHDKVWFSRCPYCKPKNPTLYTLVEANGKRFVPAKEKVIFN